MIQETEETNTEETTEETMIATVTTGEIGIQTDEEMTVVTIDLESLAQGQTTVQKSKRPETGLLVQVYIFLLLSLLKMNVALVAPIISGSTSRPNLDPDAPEEEGEEGEEMDATNDDDDAMMTMMGLSGFGTTKV